MAKVNENNEVIDAATGDVLKDSDGNPIVIEGVYRNQGDVDKAVQKRTEGLRENVATVQAALDAAEGSSTQDKQQIDNLQEMLEKAKGELSTVQSDAEKKSRDRITELTTANNVLTEEKNKAVSDMDQLTVDTAILGQAGVEGRVFTKSRFLMDGLKPAAKFVEVMDDSGKATGARELKFKVSVPRKVNGDFAKDKEGNHVFDDKLVPVEKAAEIYAEQNPEVIQGRGSGGSGGSGAPGQETGGETGLRTIYKTE